MKLESLPVCAFFDIRFNRNKIVYSTGLLFIIVKHLNSALDKVLYIWVFCAIFTHPFLTELSYLDYPFGYRVLLMGARITDI